MANISSVCVCIASGPSLTSSDCDIVRRSGAFVIAINDSWIAAPWANIIYARDLAWWDAHHDSITSHAMRYTSNQNIADRYGIHHLREPVRGMSNSGADAIRLAAEIGYERIILIGYDCSIENGSHWHGDHKKTKNPTQDIVSGWLDQFRDVANSVDARIINCSRYSALECFDKMDLEEALSG